VQAAARPASSVAEESSGRSNGRWGRDRCARGARQVVVTAAAKPERRHDRGGRPGTVAMVRCIGLISRLREAGSKQRMTSRSASRWGSGPPRTGRSAWRLCQGQTSRVTSALATPPSESMLAMLNVSGNLPSARPCCSPVGAMLSIGRCRPGCTAPYPRRSRRREDLQRLQQWGCAMSVPVPAASGRPTQPAATAGADDTTGDAMEVTHAAAPPTTATAAMPVTRVFRVTVVLSIGPTHQRGNKCCWCVDSYTAHKG